jgi:hypothetical protein
VTNAEKILAAYLIAEITKEPELVPGKNNIETNPVSKV